MTTTTGNGGNSNFLGEMMATAGARYEGYRDFVWTDSQTLLMGNPSEDALYIYDRSGNSFSQTQKIVSVRGFGTAVDAYQNEAVIAAYGSNLYMYKKNGATWALSQTLDVQMTYTTAYDGASVAIFGTTCVIGAPTSNSAVVFAKNGANWAYLVKLTGTSGQFGWSVAVNGATMMVSAKGVSSNAGAVYVYNLNNGQWVQVQTLVASDTQANLNFGQSVSISGNVAMVSTLKNWVYVFVKNGATWAQTQKLVVAKTSAFGTSVSVNGNLAVIDSGGGYDKNGEAYIYEKNGGTNMWSEKQRMTINRHGHWGATSMSTDVAVVGQGYNTGSGYKAMAFAWGNLGLSGFVFWL